jgi:hypothetical protein
MHYDDANCCSPVCGCDLPDFWQINGVLVPLVDADMSLAELIKLISEKYCPPEVEKRRERWFRNWHGAHALFFLLFWTWAFFNPWDLEQAELKVREKLIQTVIMICLIYALWSFLPYTPLNPEAVEWSLQTCPRIPVKAFDEQMLQQAAAAHAAANDPGAANPELLLNMASDSAFKDNDSCTSVLQAQARCRSMFDQYLNKEADAQLLATIYIKILIIPGLFILTDKCNGALNKRGMSFVARQVKRIASLILTLEFITDWGASIVTISNSYNLQKEFCFLGGVWGIETFVQSLSVPILFIIVFFWFQLHMVSVFLLQGTCSALLGISSARERRSVIAGKKDGIFDENGKLILADFFQKHSRCHSGLWTVAQDVTVSGGDTLHKGEILCAFMNMKGNTIWTLKQWQKMSASSRKTILDNGVHLRVLATEESKEKAERKTQAVKRGKNVDPNTGALPGVDARGVPTGTPESNGN